VASITIRNLDDRLKSQLRVRAAQHGRSMEEEVRVILRCALAASDPPPLNLAQRIHERFRALGGFDLPLPARAPLRDPPAFDP